VFWCEVPQAFQNSATERQERSTLEEEKATAAQRSSLEKSLTLVERQIDNLTKLRVRDLIDDTEYLKNGWSLTGRN